MGFVVASSPQRCQQAAAEHPGAEIASEVGALWAGAKPDVGAVASPNSSYAEIASAAVERGVPLVVDKPLAITANNAEALVARAASAGPMLTVFQNRRWDTAPHAAGAHGRRRAG